MDWRDALARMRAAPPRRTLERLLATVPRGAHVVLVRPKITRKGWTAPWLDAVRRRTWEWADLLRADNRFRLVRKVPRHGWGHRAMVRVKALVFVRAAGA
jgi:hypothetical protein